MSLARRSKQITAGFGAALVAFLVGSALDHYYDDASLQVTEQRHQITYGISQVGSVNRELTQLARLYVSTGDEHYRKKYRMRSQDGRTLKILADSLRSAGLTPVEEQQLTQLVELDRQQLDLEVGAMAQRYLTGQTLPVTTPYLASEQAFAKVHNQLSEAVNTRLNAEFMQAWHNAEQAENFNILVQLMTLGWGLWVFMVFMRRRLLQPLLILSERMQRLQRGEPLEPMPPHHAVSEITALAEAIDAFADVTEELRRQYWVKGRMDEMVQSLQLCTSRALFADALEQQLAENLGCESDLVFDGDAVAVRTAAVHYSLPLLQDGQQLASLELYFDKRPEGAHLSLLDALCDRLGALLLLLLKRLHNQQLLSQAVEHSELLEATESWYRSIVEIAPEALLVLDRTSGVILANRESEVVFGYAPGELLGQGYRALVPDSKLMVFDDLLDQLHGGLIMDALEGVAMRADGSQFPIEMRLCSLPARLDRGECLCAVIRDLSQRKEAERRLLEAHELQQTIVAAAPYGIALVSGGRIMQANSRLDELLGYQAGEQLQQSPQIWMDQNLELEEQQAIEAHARELLLSGETYQQQLLLTRKDGSRFWGSLSARLIPRAGDALSSIWIIEDVSAQHAAANEMLSARQLAEESVRTKADFLANMSHEIRTPMNAIIGMTHLALRTDLDPRQRDYLSKVQSSSRHLLGVLDDILDFSKIEAGKLQLERRDFSLSQLLEDVADQVRPRIADKHLDLFFDIDADVPEWLCGDPLRLRQVLLNYLSNAVKFTERGQIRVGVKRCQLATDGDVLHFSVTDSGIGLSSEQVLRLFQSFQQADASTTRRFGGTGLGLAIAKQLVELMDGQVGVQSVLGEGSSFWFEARLPLAQQPVADHEPNSAYSSGWLAAEGTRILLVEDNELNQQVAAELLRAAGCNVDIAGDGQQALQCLAAECYHLVFMDMQMPVLDGLSATRLLRQQPGLAGLPVIAMTANAMQRDRDACLEAGMNDFLSKPFEPDTLYAVLQHWLPGAAVAPVVAQPAAPVLVSSPLQGVQLDGVDMVAGLRRVLGKRSLYLDLLHKFLSSQSSLLEQLGAALAANELASAELLAHSCKGVAATIGANAVAQAADGLEQALGAGRPHAELQIHLDALAEPLAQLLEQLREQLHSVVETAPVEVDALQLRQVCRQLSELLEDFDAEAVPYFAEHAGLLRSAFAEAYRKLDSAVQRFDFELARVCLSQALQAREEA